MLWLWIVLGALGSVVAIVVLVGMMLPKNHRAVVTRELPVPTEKVWAVLTELESAASWRRDIKSVERLPDRDGRVVFREVDRRGDGICYEILAEEAPRRLVRRIADTNLPYGGSWTFELRPSSVGCLLSITEDGEVYNPIFRFLSRFVMGHARTLHEYVAALDKRVRRIT